MITCFSLGYTYKAFPSAVGGLLLALSGSTFAFSSVTANEKNELSKLDSVMFVTNQQGEIFEFSLKKFSVRSAFDHKIQCVQIDHAATTLLQLGILLPTYPADSLNSATSFSSQPSLWNSPYRPSSVMRGDMITECESLKLISRSSLTPYAKNAIWYIFSKPEKRVYRFVDAAGSEYDHKYFGTSDKDGSVAYSSDESSGKFVFTDSDSGVSGDQPYKEVVQEKEVPRQPFNPLDFTANTASFGRNSGGRSSVYSSVIDLGYGSAAQTSRPNGGGNGSLLLTPNAISVIPLIQLPDGSYEPVLVPEPSTLVVTLCGFCATIWRRKRYA